MTSRLLFTLALTFILAQPFHWPPESDAANYVHASQSLLRGEGWLNAPEHQSGRSAFVQWPPLYPVTLAGIRLIGVDLQTGIRLLNAACFALTATLLWGHLSRWRAPLVLALFMPFFVWNYRFAWSEPLFNLLVVIFFGLLFRRPLPLLALAIVATLAWLQRYSGVAFVVTGALYIVWQWGWRPALAFGLLPVVSMGGWLLRNLALVGAPMGERGTPNFSAEFNIASAIGHWLIWIGIIGLCFAFDWIARYLHWRFLSSGTPSS